MLRTKEEIAKAFAADIYRIVQKVLASDLMVNDKVGRNTIHPDSRLYNYLRVQSEGSNDLLMRFMLNDYLVYVESGRRPNSKFPPVGPIVAWMKRHMIPTDNSTVFLIRRAIARDGIKPRPFLAKVFEDIDDIWDGRWSETLFTEILTEVDNFFNE